MAEQLDYARRKTEHGPIGFVWGLTVTSVICFVLPFVLLFGVHLANPHSSEAGMAVIIPVMLLWLASFISSAVGLIAGIVVWRGWGPGLWLVMATLFNGCVAAFFLLVLVAMFARSLVRGY